MVGRSKKKNYKMSGNNKMLFEIYTQVFFMQKLIYFILCLILIYKSLGSVGWKTKYKLAYL